METVNISVITSLYKCATFLESFLTHYARIENLHECELILVHNDPTDEELEIIQRFISPHIRVIHLAVKREGLYASWNRGIMAANGKYLAIWNVDDIRTPNSLLAQRQSLDESGAAISYGDFYGTRSYGPIAEKLYEYDEYAFCKKEAFKRHIIGPFPMWRKDIHDTVGYFDEQFRLVSDYEFQLRVIRHYPLVKAAPVLGYYLENAGHKLSSNRLLQSRERTAVELRYRMFDKILIHFLPMISQFKRGYVLNFGIWVAMSTLLPKQRSLQSKEILSFLGMPFSYGRWFVKRSLQTLYHLIVRKEARLP